MNEDNILIFENEKAGTYKFSEEAEPCIVAECDELLGEREKEDYRTFVDRITGIVAEKAGPDYKVTGRQVLKNNSVILDSISILQTGRTVSPSFFLDDYYSDYVKGMPSDVIADRILDNYRHCMHGVDSDMLGDFSFERMKSRIVFKLVNYEMNREMLAETPHIRYLDLAVYFCCLVKLDRQGMGTVRLTQEHCDRWGVSIGELKACAMENAPYIMPHTFKNIFNVLAEIILEEYEYRGMDDSECVPVKDMIGCLEAARPGRKGDSIFVLSTPNHINGAACLLYDGLLEEIREKLGSGFFIIPSSINEVLIVPDVIEGGRALFENMVPEVNRDQVPASEVLSDRVYHYPEDNFRI